MGLLDLRHVTGRVKYPEDILWEAEGFGICHIIVFPRTTSIHPQECQFSDSVKGLTLHVVIQRPVM